MSKLLTSEYRFRYIGAYCRVVLEAILKAFPVRGGRWVLEIEDAGWRGRDLARKWTKYFVVLGDELCKKQV